MNLRKPKLNYEQQVQHLVSKGIMFQQYDKKEAVQYLASHNNFFKLMSYRKNYPKSDKTGKYIHMDFAHMIDLARIDTRLRVLMLEMCLNVEHFSKVELLDKITNSDSEDGYSIIRDYRLSLTDTDSKILNSELDKNKYSAYVKDLYYKHIDNLPIWAFTEMISFGRFIHFYGFCAKRFNSKKMLNSMYLLLSVKKNT